MSSETRRPLQADDILTARELSEMLRLPLSTIHDLARRRVIPSIRLGRRRVFLRQRIEALLWDDGPPD
jgi:excisionase family DNA binding protein